MKKITKRIVIPIFVLYSLSFKTQIFGVEQKEYIIPEIFNSKEFVEWETVIQFEDISVFKELDEKLSKTYFDSAKSLLIESLDIFKTAQDTVSKKQLEYDPSNYPNDVYDWQKKEREIKFEQSNNEFLKRSRIQSLNKIVKGMEDLNKVEGVKIKESPQYVELKANLFREYIKHQYSLKNYFLAANILEKYLGLSEKYKEEQEAHQVLAACFEKLEIGAQKLKEIDNMFYYRSKKNEHTLLFAKLKFGENSKEYNRIVDKLNKY